MSKRSEALEARRKVGMVLAAANQRMTSAELHESPLLDGMPVKAIGAHLRQLVREKLVRRNKDGSWSSVKERTAVTSTEEASEGKSRMRFVLNTKNRTLELNIDGIQLPVDIVT